MKKGILTLGAVMVTSTLIFGQVSVPGGGGAIVPSSNSNVGIGTIDPPAKLSLSGNETPRDLGTSKECAIRIHNEYADKFGANTEIQFGIGERNQTGATIASKYTNWSNDKVGADILFGTQNPRNEKEAGVKERMRITHDGNVGIGTTTPTEKLTVNGNMLFGDGNKTNNGEPELGIEWHTSNYGGGFGHRIYATDPSQQTFLHFAVRHSSATFVNAMSISSTGNVGIGTTKVAGFKLSVDGKVRATEIEVSLSSGWADYVFADDYKLSSLKEVEAYIEENNHLPNVPSADEVEENGVNLGEMDAILLRKIEELTLYMIELKKENEVQRKMILELTK